VAGAECGPTKPHNKNVIAALKPERQAMTAQGFVASHQKDARFERGLRSFYEYRDLDILKRWITDEVPAVNP
jgi:hypothetical protein